MSTTVPTIFDLASTIYTVESHGKVSGRRIQDGTAPVVTAGLKPMRAPAQEGLHLFKPEELLSLYVHQIAINGRVIGYQREVHVPHARRVAAALLDGKPMPLIHVALDGRGRMAIVDGQHRALGAVIARTPIEGVVKRMDKTEQAELFFGQRNARTVDPNVLVLAGSSAYARYVQEALENSGHAWNGMVSANRTSKTRIGPYAMFQLVLRYVANVETGGAKLTAHVEDRWDRGFADELAPLIACFGNKQTNPLAFRPSTLQAIGATAMHVFRRHDRHPDDFERWQHLMPVFPFDAWLHIRTQRHMVGHLLDHWNKRLSSTRRISR